jgi:hypothetical protein
MSTGLIIAIAVVAALILLAVLVLMPRMRRRGAERRMEERRGEVADRHRREADERATRAELAEQEARRSRAEADLHASRAEMTERGMADDALPDAGDRRFERDRELAGEPDRSSEPAAAETEQTRFDREQDPERRPMR